MKRPRIADEIRKAREGLFVALPREAAKTHGYDTDPEVLLSKPNCSGLSAYELAETRPELD
jgi:hypothetical protein